MSVHISYFVHGTTEDNIHKLASGQADAKLSSLGIEQSKALARQVHDTFDAVFVSDLSRSIDSAQLAWKNQYKIIIDKRLRECDYGDLTQKKKDWDIQDFVEQPYPGGESYLDVEKRIASFMEFLKSNFDGKHIAIVAHQAPQLALDVLLRGKSWKKAIEEDWRKRKAWQPGWEYFIE